MDSPVVDPSPVTPQIIVPHGMPEDGHLPHGNISQYDLSQEEDVAVIGDPVDLQDFCRMPKGRVRRGLTPARRGKGIRGWRRPVSFKRKDRLLFTGPPPALPEGSGREALRTLILSNLQWWMDDCVLRDAGNSYGQVRAIKLLDHSWTGRSTGLALVEFTNPEAAGRALFDKGRAWAHRQNERAVNICQCPEQIISHMMADGDGTFRAHWSQGGYISEATCSSIFELAGVPSQSVIRSQSRSQVSERSGESNDNFWNGEQFATLLRVLCESHQLKSVSHASK